MAQLFKWPTSVQVMISWFMSSSPTSGSVLTAQSCPSPLSKMNVKKKNSYGFDPIVFGREELSCLRGSLCSDESEQWEANKFLTVFIFHH